ncbi:MAG: hypothetical protein ACTTH7_06160 [Treponema sp.]
MKIKLYSVFVCAVLLPALAASCMSIPKESDIPHDVTPIDLTQKAQEAFDARNYRAANAYYHIILQRFPDDPAACVAAEYEIAHLLIKKRKWQQAYTNLEIIIEKYGKPEGRMLPPHYYKLAQIDYEKAKAKLKK